MKEEFNNRNNILSLNNHKKIIIVITIIFMALLFLLLKQCSLNKNNTPNSKSLTPEQLIIQKMKEDESYLFSLYDSSNICNKDWIKDYRNIGKTFKNYINEYHGDNDEIIILLNKYIDYGTQIEEIAISIDEANIDESIILLESLKDTSNIIERELQALYDETFIKH